MAVAIQHAVLYEGRMAIIQDDLPANIARRIRAERTQRNWSLAELAQRSGVSKAMLSAIERGEASPTASLLVRIASAFGMTLSSLIARAETGGGGLARAANQPEWRDPESGYVRRHLSPASEMPLELVRVELPAGKSVSFPASSYAFIRQQIWLLAGRLDLHRGRADACDAARRLPGARVAGRLHIPCARSEAGDLSGRADEKLVQMPRRPKRTHNGGPPLQDYKGPPWGKGEPYVFLAWRTAHRKAWKPASREVAQ